MTTRLQIGIHRTVSWTFAQIVRVWPQGSREWALAMQSELSEIDDPQESLSWLTGGVMSLGKAWWNQVMFGWNKNETEPKAVTTPGPAALVLALAAVASLLFVPSAKDGFRAVLRGWSMNDDGPSWGALQKMAREAETEHDAKTIVFTLPWARSAEERARMLDEAVAMDPSLTWAYIQGVGSWYDYLGVPQKRTWAKKLEEWDPDNAVPYLAEANNRWGEIQSAEEWRAPMAKILNDSEWRASMEKAFAAPRMVSYFDRATDLQQTVLTQHNIHQFEVVKRGINQFYPPGGMYGSQVYATFLLDQAKAAQQKGDTATASRLAWTVARFGVLVRDNSRGDLPFLSAEAILRPAYEFLQPLEIAAGHTEVAKLLAIENETLARRKAALRPTHMFDPVRQVTVSAIALHVAGIGVTLFGTLLVFSLTFLVFARFAPGLRSGRAYRSACGCARFTPAGLAASVTLMAFTFAPYLEALQAYLGGARDAAVLGTLTNITNSIYAVPWRLSHPLMYGLWSVFLGERLAVFVVITIASIAMSLVLYRIVLSRQVSRIRDA